MVATKLPRSVWPKRHSLRNSWTCRKSCCGCSAWGRSVPWAAAHSRSRPPVQQLDPLFQREISEGGVRRDDAEPKHVAGWSRQIVQNFPYRTVSTAATTKTMSAIR